jgi:hypothetical protein
VRCQRDHAARVTLVFAASFAVGFLVLGYNPYVWNLRAGGHPFYPVNNDGPETPWRQSVDLHQTPRNFQKLPDAESVVFSIMAQSGSDFEPATWTWSPAVWKIPFTTSRDELAHFSWCDLRVGGWGPMFGGIFLLGLVGFVGCLAAPLRSPQTTVLVALNGAIAATAWLLPQAWMARYTPHFWLFPLSVAAILLMRPQRGWRALAIVMLSLMALNVALIGSVYFPSSLARSARLRAQFAQIAALHRPVEVSFGELRLNGARLRWAGIPYREVPERPGGLALEGNMPHVITFVYGLGGWTKPTRSRCAQSPVAASSGSSFPGCCRKAGGTL